MTETQAPAVKEKKTRKFDLDQINFVLKVAPILLEFYEDWEEKSVSNEDLFNKLNQSLPDMKLINVLMVIGILEGYADEFKQGTATFNEVKIRTIPKKLEACRELLRQLAELNPDFYDQIVAAGNDVYRKTKASD